MRLSVRTRLPMLGLALIAGTGIASAHLIKLHATLAPAAGVKSHGTGKMTGSYSTATHILSWYITYSHLTSKVTQAHFHGPAKPGANAPVLVPISGPHASPIVGKVKITEAEAKIIVEGMSYVNIHTKDYPPGEIRGQVLTAK